MFDTGQLIFIDVASRRSCAASCSEPSEPTGVPPLSCAGAAGRPSCLLFVLRALGVTGCGVEVLAVLEDLVVMVGRPDSGFRPPTREHYEAEIEHGVMFVGNPETVPPRIAESIRLLGLSRFDLKYDVYRLPKEGRSRSVELYGREVIPRVREILARTPEAANA